MRPVSGRLVLHHVLFEGLYTSFTLGNPER